MSHLIVFTFLMALASSVFAQNGDNCASAIVINSLPFCYSGTTVGLTDDYTPPCVSGSSAPDVVFSYTPTTAQAIAVSAMGSSFGTVISIWVRCPLPAPAILMCCSADNPVQQACCTAQLTAGITYMIVLDGQGTSSGNYTLHVANGTVCTPCVANTCPYPNRDQEPLNNYCQEIYDTLMCGDTVCGTINPAADLDYYHIRIPGPGCKRLTIDVFANGTPGWYPFGQGLDPMVSLLDSVNCTTYLASDDNSGIGNDAHLVSACLRPGLYRILVQGSSLPFPGTTGPYILATSCSPCLCSTQCAYPNRDFEPFNNVCDTSNTVLACADTVCGLIDNSTGVLDFDWYTITVPPSTCLQFTINVFGNGTPGWYPFGLGLDPRIELYASDCSTMLAFDDNGGIANDSRLITACLSGGIYHLKVMGVGFSQGPYVLAISCTSCTCSNRCPYPNRDQEPLNNYCQEIYDTLVCGDTVCGAINPMGDSDYYHLRIPGPGCQRLTIDVFGNGTSGWYPFGQGLDPKVYLLDSVNCSTYLAFDDNGGIANDAHLVSACLPAGLYRILVQGSGNPPTMGPYILATSCSPCVCNNHCPYPNRDQEPLNNFCLEIYDTLACGDTVCGAINPAGDVDYYHLLIPGPQCQMVMLNVFGNGTPGYYPYGQGLDPFLTLYGNNCTTALASNDNGGIGNDAYLVSTCLSPGMYKIKVNGVGNTMGPYILSIACHPCACDTCRFRNVDIEPANNTCNANNPTLGCPDTVCGAIQLAGAIDVDWYNIVIPPPACARLTVNVYGNGTPGWSPFGMGLDPRVQLFASDCSTLQEFDDNSGIGNDAQMISPCLQPGTYRIKVSGAGGTQGPYVLTTSCAPCQCGCILTCPPNIPQDQEPCPNLSGVDTYNGGCSVTPPVFEPITCGQRFCATSFAMGGIRDVDWYQLNLTSPRRILWTVNAPFPFATAIYRQGPGICDTTRLRYLATGPCQTHNLGFRCLPAGIYYLYVAPTVFNGVPCSTYLTRLACGRCVPYAMVVQRNGDNIQLNWDSDETLPQYNVYRSTTPDVLQIPANFIGATMDTTFVDSAALQRPEQRFFYTITMQDQDSSGAPDIER